MKGRIVLIAVAVALVGLLTARVAQVRSANKAPETKAPESALVRTAKVVRAEVVERISVTGTVRPRNEVDLYAKVSGRIETLTAQVGDKVKAGQILASIEHKELAWQSRAAQASLQVARANLDGARLEFDRTEALFKGGAASQAQMDGVKVKRALVEAQAAQAEASAGLAQQQVDNARVESPISGVVTRRPVNLGVQVGPQASLFTVQDVATLKLESSVDAASFVRLVKGSEARVTVDALPGETFVGKVKLLSPSLDPVNRRASVELEIDNAAGKLLSNMFAHADISVGRLPAALTLPREALYEAAGGPQIFRIHDGKAQLVRPKLGPPDGANVTVLEGLSDGDEVAVTGLASLADGAPVRVAPTGEAHASNEGGR